MRVSWLGASTLAAVGCTAILGAQGSPQRSPAVQLAVSASEIGELRSWSARVAQLSRSGELVRRSVRADTVMNDGRVHERYDQYFEGVRVFGGDLVLQVRNGSTESIFGTLHERIGVSTDPSLDEDAAVAIFRRLSAPGLMPGFRPELVVLPTDAGGYALTWRGHVWTDGGWMHTFVDAHDGSVALAYNDIQTQSAVGSGTGVLGDRKKISTAPSGGRFFADDRLRPPTLITYDMQGNFARANSLLNGLPPAAGDVASDNDNEWTDAVNVDAHVHIGWTYDFLFKRFGRRGLDDNNIPIRSITHPVPLSGALTAPPAILGLFYLNAFWCTTCGPGGQGMMVFGEGLPPGVTSGGREWKPFAGALDIAAHELTHGLTAYSSGLLNRNEPGALNEAFSDIIGTSVEFFYHPTGSGPGRADYLAGEDIVNGGGRSMSNPIAFGHPDHYSQRFLGTADNGGVHFNNGIANHAFYLAIEGGRHRFSGLDVQGVGGANREQIEKVFYRAFVFMLTSNATFSNAREATIQSARDLYGANSAAERAVTQAWSAVGVF